MTYILYIFILLIVLTIHEYGHLISAQILGVRTSRLQIGVGPTIFAHYTGRTLFLLAHPLSPLLTGRTIEFIAQWTSDDQPLTIIAWRQPRSHWARLLFPSQRIPQPFDTYWRKPPPRSISYCGRVKSVQNGFATISTMAWAIAPIPLAAFVALPESPHNDVPHCFNTTGWKTTTLITVTGVLANLALFVAITLTLPLVENPAPPAQTAPVYTQLQQQPEAPYHQRVAHTTIRYYRGFHAATKSILTRQPPPTRHPEYFSETRTICGPICAGQMTGAAVELAGLYGWLAVLGIVTIFTAMLNLLPIPPLDGWKVALNSVQLIRRKPFNPATTFSIEIAAVSLIVLAALIMFAMDLHHLIA